MAGDRGSRSWAAVAAPGFLAVTLLLGACGTGDDDLVGASDSSETTVAEPMAETDVAEDLSSTTDTAAIGSGTTEPLEDEALPGEVVDLFPYAGAPLTVIGVEVSDVLHVRVGPGPEYDVVTDLAPTSTAEAVATGRNRSVNSGIWAEVRVGDQIGWANTAYLLQSGRVDDDTAALYPTPQLRPDAASLSDLGRLVAEEYVSAEPMSKVILVDGPHHGDVGSVSYDVIGLGDDSVGGYRITVHAERSDLGYRVRSVEATTLCARGVDGGLCV